MCRCAWRVPVLSSVMRICIWPLGMFLMCASRARVSVASISTARTFFVPFESKKVPAFHGHIAPPHAVLGGRPEEIPRGFLIPGLEHHGCVRSGGDVFLKTAADLHQLRKTLHGEQEGSVGAPRGLQNLRKIPITEGSEFIEHDADQRPIRLVWLFLTLISLAHD